jgi:hypothetical protein
MLQSMWQTCARSPLSQALVLRTGEIDRAALLRGACFQACFRVHYSLCATATAFFPLKIQPQNDRGLDKFLEYKNSDQYWTTLCYFGSTMWVCGVSLSVFFKQSGGARCYYEFLFYSFWPCLDGQKHPIFFCIAPVTSNFWMHVWSIKYR